MEHQLDMIALCDVIREFLFCKYARMISYFIINYRIETVSAIVFWSHTYLKLLQLKNTEDLTPFNETVEKKIIININNNSNSNSNNNTKTH